MDINRYGRLIIRFLILLAASASLVSCTAVQDANNAASSGNVFEVAPSLREFYKTLGGEALLGPAISELFDFKSLECQYTVNTLICLDPARTGENRFGLYPLGKTLDVREEPPENIEDPDGRVVNGYSIYEEFIDLFDKFSGIKYAGAPLTQVHINYAQQRYEQFFENIGIYRNFDDAPGIVKLLAYGSAACGGECRYAPQGDSLVLGTTSQSINEPFLRQLANTGVESIFGEPLTPPYIAADGATEQVYANAVLYSPAGKENQVLLRKLADVLKLPRTDPGPQVYSNENGMVFYPVNNNLGYHVPLIFDEFIAAHGGVTFAGSPITEVSEIETGVFRQCFENYCLDFRPNLPAGEQVDLAPLGKLYLEILQQSGSTQAPMVFSSETVAISLSERSERVTSNSTQQIRIIVTSREGGQPLQGIESSLDMNLPGNQSFHIDLPATDADGSSLAAIPAMNKVPNGTILTYTVCLKTVSALPICAVGSYLIWNIP